MFLKRINTNARRANYENDREIFPGCFKTFTFKEFTFKEFTDDRLDIGIGRELSKTDTEV